MLELKISPPAYALLIAGLTELRNNKQSSFGAYSISKYSDPLNPDTHLGGRIAVKVPVRSAW